MATKVTNGLDLQAQRVTNLGAPTVGTDAATKAYVDNTAAGMAWKEPVRAASTGTVDTASPGASVDGVALAAGDRLLLKNQTNPVQNGLWIWNGPSTALTRAPEAPDGALLAPGTVVTVTEGAAAADKAFMVISDTPVTVGTDSVSWGQFGAGQAYTAGNGIILSGGEFSAKAGAGVIVDGNGVGVDPNTVVRKYATNVPASSSPAISHNLGTRDVTVAVYSTSTWEQVVCDVTHTDANTVTLGFADAPAVGAYRVVVHG